MRPKCEGITRAASFVLRIWWEQEAITPVWRGRVQHPASGDNCDFQTIDELLDFVEQHAGNLAANRIKEQIGV